MRQIRQYIVARQDEIASVISRETTRPRTETLMQEVTASLALLRHLEKRYPKWLKDSAFRELKPGFWAKSNRRVFDAIGVIAVIGPSTFPFSLVMMQACAALMCGNVVVLKPSEKCPETAALLKTIFSVLPTNVVRVIEGDALQAMSTGARRLRNSHCVRRRGPGSDGQRFAVERFVCEWKCLHWYAAGAGLSGSQCTTLQEAAQLESFTG
jgi:acyl-CoA reductase-like NAD-dependent aldehyde dehydrogenase